MIALEVLVWGEPGSGTEVAQAAAKMRARPRGRDDYGSVVFGAEACVPPPPWEEGQDGRPAPGGVAAEQRIHTRHVGLPECGSPFEFSVAFSEGVGRCVAPARRRVRYPCC